MPADPPTLVDSNTSEQHQLKYRGAPARALNSGIEPDPHETEEQNKTNTTAPSVQLNRRNVTTENDDPSVKLNRWYQTTDNATKSAPRMVKAPPRGTRLTKGLTGEIAQKT